MWLWGAGTLISINPGIALQAAEEGPAVSSSTDPRELWDRAAGCYGKVQL